MSCSAQGHMAGKGWDPIWVALPVLLPSREPSWTLHGLANLGLLPGILSLSSAQASSSPAVAPQPTAHSRATGNIGGMIETVLQVPE